MRLLSLCSRRFGLDWCAVYWTCNTADAVLRRSRLAHYRRVLERLPLEIFLITSTHDISLMTLIAARFRFVAFQSLALARQTS